MGVLGAGQGPSVEPGQVRQIVGCLIWGPIAVSGHRRRNNVTNMPRLLALAAVAWLLVALLALATAAAADGTVSVGQWEADTEREMTSETDAVLDDAVLDETLVGRAVTKTKTKRRTTGKRRTSTHKSTRKSTRKTYSNKATKSSSPSSPNGPASHIGMLFFDNNNDGQWTEGIDEKVANKPVFLLTKSGKILGKGKTDTDGKYKISSPVRPNTKLFIYLTNAQVGRITTGQKGNSRFLLPIPPADIRGTAFYDLNRNGKKEKNELVLAKTSIVLKRNGTLWKKIPTDGEGKFEFPYGRAGSRFPSARITFELADGHRIKEGKLDAAGNWVKDLAIAPVSQPARNSRLQADPRIVVVPFQPKITGDVFYDTDQDGLRDDKEDPVPNEPLTIQFTNGTFFRNVTSDTNGKFSFFTNPVPKTAFEVFDKSMAVVGSFETEKDGSGYVHCPYYPRLAEERGE